MPAPESANEPAEPSMVSNLDWEDHTQEMISSMVKGKSIMAFWVAGGVLVNRKHKGEMTNFVFGANRELHCGDVNSETDRFQ